MSTSSLLLSGSMAVAAGVVGCFAVMRRMTLAADAMSHVALPGIGLALVLHLNPVIGGVAMLLVGALLIWGLEQRTGISTETVVGVVFSAALAIGSMLASGEELIDALLGKPGVLDPVELAFGLLAPLGVVLFLAWARNRLLIALVSPDLARTVGIGVERLNLGFLVAFAVTVALGLRYLGVLLMGSLIIIPAATAKHLAGNIRSMFLVAVGVSLGATLVGSAVAATVHRPTGPLIITVAAACFLLSLAWRRPL
ncbi:MAG: metal ABC transporter permease [Myxococcaceae bacterium]